MLIEQLPPILIVHLKCFLYDEADGTKKINKSISYTVNLALPKSNDQHKYTDTFVSIHTRLFFIQIS
jgi:hypothetical protein